MSSLSDAQLVYRILQNDLLASAEFYTRHKQGIYAYCLRLLNDTRCAEDAVQNAFIKFFGSVHQLRHYASARSWLMTVARNEVYSFLRRNQNTDPLEEADLWNSDTPYEKVVREEEADLVRRMLAQLKPEYREVLILVQYEHLSYAEIATITGSTIAAVESRIFKARRALAKKLKEYIE